MIDFALERGLFYAVVGPRASDITALVRDAARSIDAICLDVDVAVDAFVQLRAIDRLVCGGNTVIAEVHDHCAIAEFADRVIVVRCTNT